MRQKTQHLELLIKQETPLPCPVCGRCEELIHYPQIKKIDDFLVYEYSIGKCLTVKHFETKNAVDAAKCDIRQSIDQDLIKRWNIAVRKYNAMIASEVQE